MDSNLRNKLQRATQAARRLLEDEFAQQLEGDFNILPDGQVLEDPRHLDEGRLFVRRQLVETLGHAQSRGKDGEEAVQGYVREAAFTFLNRMAALKMLEARGLLQECVSKGDQSAGFKESTGLAPALRDLPDNGYQLYLECLFDEIGVEVKVLFDRRDPASLLWPRRQAFAGLLAVLNDPELAAVWGQDEAIGWIYQYFNGQDERQRMRKESSAPRNSRELAVRNQFFTPRYVVEFLTDNTLGRIWFEMCKGETRLKDDCRYLVRRPNEVFLGPGEEAPATSEEDGAADVLPQEEPLKQPVHIPHRPLKDPRDIKVLDPACGSMHFGLYAFDLFERIYDEAWEAEARHGADAFARSEGLQPLRETYPDKDAYLRDVPRLILEGNIHGIDIDPRCAQIAALALWMRAQRACNQLGLRRDERPPVRRTNVVVAEPMPGEADMLKDFLRGLRDERLEGLIRRALNLPQGQRVRATKAMADSLCELVEAVWDRMGLAGEAGSLLKVEEEIASAVAKGRDEWEEKLPLFRITEIGLSGPPKETYARTVPGEEDDFWAKAETLALAALRGFADYAANGRAFLRRLFAEDAARGFAFVDLCRNKYDVVLMNPPFGEASKDSKPYIARAFPRTKNDLYAAFVERGVQLLAPQGRLGAITSRTGFFLSSFQKWREEVLLKEAPPVVFADLGYGVLDSAMVEVAAYCLAKAAG